MGPPAQLILVDSDIVVDASRHDAATVDWLDQRRSEIAVSTITHIELLSGCRHKRNWRLTQGFLARFEHLTLTPEASNSQSHGWQACRSVRRSSARVAWPMSCSCRIGRKGLP